MAINLFAHRGGGLIRPADVSLTPGSSLSLSPSAPKWSIASGPDSSGNYGAAAARSSTPFNFDPAYNQDLTTFQNSGGAQYLQTALANLASSSGPQTPITTGAPSASAGLAGSVVPPSPQGPAGMPFGQLITSLLSGGVFSGANPNQVPAAQQSQIYEATADDISNAVKAGILTPAQAQEAIQATEQLGNYGLGETVSNLAGNTNKNIQNSVPLMDQVIQNELAGINALPPVAQIPFNASALPGIFMNPNTPGWYPGSLSQGNQLATQLISNLLNSTMGGATSGTPTPAAPAA